MKQLDMAEYYRLLQSFVVQIIGEIKQYCVPFVKYNSKIVDRGSTAHTAKPRLFLYSIGLILLEPHKTEGEDPSVWWLGEKFSVNIGLP